MQSSNQGQTPQFIKTMDYNDDCVRNSLEGGPNNQMIQQNYRSYKSPGRGGYESRYPASYNGFRQDNENLNMNFSPAKYSMNANNLNARRGNFAVETSPQDQLSRGGYVSPPRSNTFIPSPYVSQNYRPISQNQSLRPQLPLYSPSNMQTTKSAIQLQKLVSELKISLQQSLSVQSSLQEQLHKERSRSFELSEIKRKLQEELSKMEFQLEKIMNSDVLGQRELAIKYEAVSLQNQRLNSQINDLMDELKRVKKECRQVMTQNNQSKQQCEILKQQNGELIQKVDELAEEIKVLKHEYNQSVLRQQQKLHQQNMMRIQNQQQYYIPSNGHIPSNGNINTITTTRTHEEESGQGSHLMSPTQKNARSFQNPQHFMMKSPFNNVNYAPQAQNVVGGYVNVQQSQSQENIGSSQAINSNFKNQLNYEMENSKLVDDYNKLLVENESMKKLYKQFYQQSPRKVASFNSPPNSQHQRSISEYSEEYESSYRQNGEELDTERLQTFQKHELFGQISSLRQEIVNDLMRKYYAQALHQAEVKKTNVLVCFIKLMSRDLELIQKMVANYLQARDLLKKQLNVKRLQEGEEGNPTTKPQIEAEKMWQTVKQKLKVELKSHKNSEANRPSNQSELVTLNINAYFLGLFRLLTLINKHEAKDIDPQSKTLSKIKHSALKYVQKIYEESYLLKLNSKKNTVISYNSGGKVSMKK